MMPFHLPNDRLLTPRRACCLLLAVLLASTGLARADAPALSPATLRKVKRATVHLEVKAPSGAVCEGSGFFVDQPGLIVTNAHVLGMLEPNSRRPLQVTVTVNSGEPDSKSYPGQVLGADRGTDLAVLRIQGKELPEPLKLGTSKNISELQDVYVFGFPFGKRLGKNITVSKSSVSSLRKRPSGGLDRIQVNGGMNPGNSGGPLTDAEGQVIGVAVSVIKNTSINFAVPSDLVYEFLNGRIDFLSALPAYRDGGQVKQPVRVHLIDPLGRTVKVALETWTGTPGKPRPETGPTEPQAQPGDSAKQTVALVYNKKTGLAEVDLVLPKLADPKQVVWIRPTVTHPAGDTYWVMAYSLGKEAPVERQPLRLKYQPPAKLMFVDLSSRASLRMRDDEGGEGNIRSSFRVVMREQPAEERGAEGGRQFHMKFAQVTANVSINDKPLTGKGKTTPMLNDMVRNVALDVEMDGEGNLTQPRVSFGQAPRESRGFITSICDQVVPSLMVLTVPLSGETFPPLKSWKVQRLLDVGPMSLSLPAQADLKYTYLGVREQGGQKEAVLGVEGTLRGQRSNAGNVAGSITGSLILSPETGQVVNANATLKLDMDATLEGSPLKMNGELVVNLKRNDKPPPGVRPNPTPTVAAGGKTPPPSSPPGSAQAAEAKTSPLGWTEYSPKDASFSVLLPEASGRRSERERTMTVRGMRIKINLVSVEARGGLTYEASTLLLPPRMVRTISPKERLEIMRDIFLNEVGGKVTDATDVTVGGAAGKEYTIQARRGVARLRVVARGGRLYRASVIGAKAQVASKDADTFLESYRLSGRAPKPPAEAPANKGKEKTEVSRKTDAPVLQWIADAGKMQVPDAPAAGKLLGGDFQVDNAKLSRIGWLVLEQGKGDAEINIVLFLKRGGPVDDKSFQINAHPTRGERRPHLHVSRKVEAGGPPKRQGFVGGYAMRLEFGKEKDGEIPAKIYLCLPDDDKSVVAGTFTVKRE